MITVHDKDFNIIHANKAAEKILGLPFLKSKTAKCYQHYHGESSPPKGCPSCECLKSEKPVAFETYEPHLNKFLEIRAMPQFDGNNQLIGVIHIVRDITERKQMEEEITSLKKHLLTGELENEAAFSSIITKSKKMRAIFQYIEAVAKSQKPVFITGETGVGKELVARSVHLASGLKGEYIAVNVAGLDDTMFSDTLFGHKKGAFTGADKDREGLIVRASGGTLLLDEIGDLNKSSQVKLLRLLEERIYYPLGSDTPEKSGARIIACSNQDIQEQIEKGSFRNDLYYRLCAHHIHIPPLRERLQDIPLLLDHFIRESAGTMNKKQPVLSPELITLLSNYQFPGNVRELQAMVHDAVAQYKSGKLSLDSFKGFIKQRRPLPQTEAMPEDENSSSLKKIFGHFPSLKEMEDHIISEAMKCCDDNQGSAASLLGITRQALNQRLKKKNKSP
ncbi:MAG: sigma 54-interacting transcriptional regulator [Nitrospirae bacterium]|nr:sigma 54-interacting transcriptional regulator [Nitrospirota bacterium]